MKILFISQYFHPENFRGNDIAFDLAKEHEVHVVTGLPNYPDGEIYKGYGWFKRQHEVVNGVKVTRIPIFARGHNSFTLMLNYFSYMINAGVYAMYLAVGRKYDFVFVQQLSPVMMSMPGILYKVLRNVPLYTWVLDLWPESLRAAGGIKSKMVLSFFALFVKIEYKWSDRLLVSSESFTKSILQYGNYSSKIHYFPQWAEDSVASSVSVKIDVPSLPAGFKIIFAGAVGEAQGFEYIMRAALLTKNCKDIKWVIVGDGRKWQWVERYVKENDLAETVFTPGRFPVEAMPRFFEQADVMLVSLKDKDIFRMTAPAKIQAYMAAGKPIVAMLNGEGADVISKANCGYSVPAEDAESLAKLVFQLSQTDKSELERKGKNGLTYYQLHFTKERCLENLRKMIIR